MKHSALQSAEKYAKEHTQKSRWCKIVTGLACVVVFCTAYALILPAVTMEQPPCTIPEHTHSEACYTQVMSVAEKAPVCSAERLTLHQHTDSCYDREGNMTCGLADFVVHQHDTSCFYEDGTLWCPLPEVKPHTHSEICYAGSELICDEEEIILHEHARGCLDQDGNLICGQIQVLEHQHTDDCFETAEESVDAQALTCINSDANHTHSALCYGTSALTCGMEEHTHSEECVGRSKSAEKTLSIADKDAGSPTGMNLPNPLAEGTLNISLLYGDGKPQGEYPDGASYYTHNTMSGYIKLEPSNLTADLTDVTVTLTVPKQYTEKDSINIPAFTTDSDITQYEILPVVENGDNYCISILFSAYDKTQTLVLPFALSFLDDVVPDNYQLPVTASVFCGETISKTTDPNLYKPLYKEWGIDKYVNSNKLDAFRKDGAEVVVTPQEENGNPYLDDLTYVDFAFIVNNYLNSGSNLNDFRDASSVTLTDPLPTYVDKDGVSCIAAFDPEVNPGWTLNAEGTAVSKTYSGANSADVLAQISNDELHLRFPGLKFETDKDGNLIADLTNTVSLLAIPSNEAERETRPTAQDPLLFRITNDPVGHGKLIKVATKGDIYDVDVYKTNQYPWKLRLSNENSQPLQHITIQDCKIVEGENVVLSGLDEALKFVRLESVLTDSALPQGKTFADIVEKVVAFYADGSTEDYLITEVDASGNFSITFDENKVCAGYEIQFSDSYAMKFNEAVSFMAYSVFRDPTNTHVPEEAEKVTYRNNARSVSWYSKAGETVFVYLSAGHQFDMLPTTENITVTKQTYYNSATENNKVGDIFSYYIALRGSLLEPEVKEYEDLRIVDLLPNEVDYVKITSCGSASKGYLFDEGIRYQPEIIENYHNSGRTAVIFHLKAEKLQTLWDNNHGLATLIFQVKINTNARPGTARNDVYVVGDNLDEYQNKTGGVPDEFDLNKNGRTDDMVAHDSSDAVIIAAQVIYSEKFIAPAGSDNWTKQGLILKPGSDFDYLLRVTNETVEEHTGLVVYDTLPEIGDCDIFGSTARNSEFSVRLREAITPPEGYTVYYTTSTEVYQKSMSEMVSADIWTDTVTDYFAVTAFKLVAEEGTTLPGASSFQVRIPAHATAVLSEDSMERLQEKSYQDQESGRMAYLEAINAFGFRTDQTAAEKESNTVWSRIPFAGFSIKKVDSKSKNGIIGAEFTLSVAEGAVIQTVTSDQQGKVEFRDLTEGTYTLTETKVPTGYIDSHISLIVTIKQHPVTREYEVIFSSSSQEAGTASDPLRIENVSGCVLPNTGGAGLLPYSIGGLLLMTGAVLLLLYHHTKRRKENGTFS